MSILRPVHDCGALMAPHVAVRDGKVVRRWVCHWCNPTPTKPSTLT